MGVVLVEAKEHEWPRMDTVSIGHKLEALPLREPQRQPEGEP